MDSVEEAQPLRSCHGFPGFKQLKLSRSIQLGYPESGGSSLNFPQKTQVEVQGSEASQDGARIIFADISKDSNLRPQIGCCTRSEQSTAARRERSSTGPYQLVNR
jgi:hypothetical protein